MADQDNREVKTDLYNILSHVSCAVDYGYYDDVLMSDFADLTGYVTDKEIEAFILDSKSDEYTQEDYETWRDRIVAWRDRYGKDTGEVTIDSGADVCEWEEAEFHYMIPSCCGHDLNIKELVEDYNFCPYCGKPITIKGE